MNRPIIFAGLIVISLGLTLGILRELDDRAVAMRYTQRGWFRCNGDKAEFGNINFDRFKPDLDIVCVRHGWM